MSNIETIEEFYERYFKNKYLFLKYDISKKMFFIEEHNLRRTDNIILINVAKSHQESPRKELYYYILKNISTSKLIQNVIIQEIFEHFNIGLLYYDRLNELAIYIDKIDKAPYYSLFEIHSYDIEDTETILERCKTISQKLNELFGTDKFKLMKNDRTLEFEFTDKTIGFTKPRYFEYTQKNTSLAITEVYQILYINKRNQNEN